MFASVLYAYTQGQILIQLTEKPSEHSLQVERTRRTKSAAYKMLLRSVHRIPFDRRALESAVDDDDSARRLVATAREGIRIIGM